jgi:type II secretory ATPase GspE/PulE/Tfp pilus assembly ATPase PilB-like protein
LCKECALEYTPSANELTALGIDARLAAGRKFKRARGCRACEGSGFRGRIAMFELLEMDEALREMTFRGDSLDLVRAGARQSGALRSLLQDGARKILRGDTSTTEVMRVTRLAASSELDF